MGVQIFLAVVLWLLGLFFSIAGGFIALEKEDGGGLLAWVGGMLVMLAIWQSWIIYKFYILPLGL